MAVDVDKVINKTIKYDRQGLSEITDYQDDFVLPQYQPHNHHDDVPDDALNIINVDSLQQISEDYDVGNDILTNVPSPTALINGAFNFDSFQQALPFSLSSQ